MIKVVWHRMWVWHEQAKGFLQFFTRGESDSFRSSKDEKKEFIDDNDFQFDPRGQRPSYTKAQLIGLVLGPLLFIITLLFFRPEDLSMEGVAIAASTLWIATWWITEAIPIPATSLLPLVLFPLTRGLDMSSTASSYGNDTIFLFMGGFMIALTMEKWGLHRRIALTIISLIGTNMRRIVLGFMVATGFLSMWISNTATAMMMVPIGLAIIYQISDALKNDPTIDTSRENFSFGKALMLGIAYSASIGGIATLIGTPPNALLAGAIREMYGIDLSFAKWMLFGTPLAWSFLLLAWFYLVRIAYPMNIKEIPGAREIIDEEKQKMGRASTEEKLVFTIFLFAALSWITRTYILEEINEEITDGIIAIIFALLLFIIPSVNRKGDHLLDWDTAMKLPWGILLLFGGGLAIAAGFVSSGLSEWIGGQLTGLRGISLFLVILIVTALVIFLTEITSNTATASMMYPIMASLAVALGFHPYALMVAAGVAASCAFMLPVATPPNAVVFGSGYLRIPDMAKAGFALNIIGIIIVTIGIFLLLPLFWGLDLTVIPEDLLSMMN